jgi:DNA-binding protein HU-beta
VRIECVVIDVCRIDRGLIGSSIELLNFLNHDPGDHMNKSELIEVIAKDAELSKAAAGSALDAAIAAIVKAVSKGDTVTLIGFGTFKSSKRAARTGRNPQTGKELKIAATTVPRFTAGAGFKTAVAGKKAAKKK